MITILSTKKSKIIVFTALFATAAAILLYSTQAATPNSDIEAESGQISGNAVMVTDDTTASGQTHVSFNDVTMIVKPQIKGMVDRFGYDSSKPIDLQNLKVQAGYESVIKNVVVMLNWKQLQPNNTDELDTSYIDDAISEANAKGIHIKLRILAGINSPTWVQTASGGSFHAYDIDPILKIDFGGFSPLYWTDGYKTAYSNLMSKLAAKYDHDQTILSVSNTMCTTIFGEPFIRNFNEGTPPLDNFTTYTAAGLTTALDKQCEDNSIDVHNSAWKYTRTETALNPMAYIDTDSVGNKVEKFDATFTISWVYKCRQILGDRCIMGNNGFNATVFGLGYRQVMGAVICEGNPPPYFQTRQLAALTASGKTVAQVAQYAVDVGAGMLELPSGYQNAITPAQVAPFDVALRANSVIPCPADKLLPNPS